MIPLTDRALFEADIADAKDQLDFARLGSDKLTIALREAALNDLLERYRQMSQPETEKACH